MRGRRRYILIIAFSFLLFSYPVFGIPPHVDFDEADRDLYSIVSFLDDTKILCEKTLEYSILSNCTINFDKGINLFYSKEYQEFTLEKTFELSEKLSFSADIIDNIKDKASSYIYLKDFLLILKYLGEEVTEFSYFHNNIIINLKLIVDFINGFGNEIVVVNSLINARLMVSNSKSALSNIKFYLNELNQSFSTENLRNLIPLMLNILEKYDSYIDSLIQLLEIDEPIIFLDVGKKENYLGEQANAYGYIIANKDFISNQNVNLFWNDTLINETSTDETGRYEFVVNISLKTITGNYNLSTSKLYNNTIYSSNNFTILIKKIPTNIYLNINKKNYYLNETIYFSGKLYDYKKRGIEADLTLFFAGLNIPLKSDEEGNFSYAFNENLSFGKYFAYVSFNPPSIYKSAISKTIEIKINTPTILTIYTSKNKLVPGEDFTINGSLNSGINGSFLNDKTIEIYSNERKIGSVKTDRNGHYNFSLKTDSFKKGKYNIYSKFKSEEEKWRSTSSKIIYLQILTIPSKSYFEEFFVPIILIIIFGIISYLLFYRNKPYKFFKRKKLPTSDVFEPYQDISNIKISNKSNIDINNFTIDLSKKQTDGFKNVIISKYHALLTFLTDQDFNICRGVTHLDIRNQMLKYGLSKKATNIVTKAFEYAKYSPYTLDKNDAILFNRAVSTILKNLGVV